MPTPISTDKAAVVGNRIGIVLFVVSLVAYFATLSFYPFPGLPALSLWRHIGGDGVPPTADALWGTIVRLADRLPGVPFAYAMNVFSAICGAACVGLTGWLMGQARYRGLMVDKVPARFAIEATARRMSCWVAGLYLASCIPFWVAATRSLPDSFHLLLMLLTISFFAWYRQSGRMCALASFGFLCGAGTMEYPTFLILLPVSLFLVLRAFLRDRVFTDWRCHVAYWGPFIVGLFVNPLLILSRSRQTEGVNAFGSLFGAFSQTMQNQFGAIALVRFNPGLLLILSLSVVPWLMLFVFSRRSPWHYGLDQIAVRVLLASGLLAVLYDAPFAPWSFLNMGDLMLMPHLLMATCLGQVVGEFWILGRSPLSADVSHFRRTLQFCCMAMALLVPALIVIGGVRNVPMANARPASSVHAAACMILERLHGRDIVFSGCPLDISLQLEARDRGQPLLVIDMHQMRSPVYLSTLARHFPEGRAREHLNNEDPNQFLNEVLLSDSFLSRIAVIEPTDAFREYAYLVPDALLYRLQSMEGTPESLGVTIGSQESCWTDMERIQLAPAKNLVRPYQQYVLCQAARVANNLGVVYMRGGNEELAANAFREALKLDADNLSARMNLLDLGRHNRLPDLPEMEAQWHQRLDKAWANRWGLSMLFGYVWNAREWMQSGSVWALSGAPSAAEGAKRHPFRSKEIPWERDWLLELARHQFGANDDEFHFHSRLYRNDRDLEAMRGLCHLALLRNDPEVAEAYLAEALAAGSDESSIAFDRAMVTYIREGKDGAIQSLRLIIQANPSDLDAWLALALLTEEDHPMNREAIRCVQDLNPSDIGVHLALAWIHMRGMRLDSARFELDSALSLDSNNAIAWEWMFSLARIRDDPKWMQTCRRTLLERHPNHPLRTVQAAWEDIQRGHMDIAETKLRQMIRTCQNPDVLYLLAKTIIEQGGDMEESHALLMGAVAQQPFTPAFRLARADARISMGRLDEATADLDVLRRVQPESTDFQIIELRRLVAAGDVRSAWAAARQLAERRSELSEAQKELLIGLVAKLKSP